MWKVDDLDDVDGIERKMCRVVDFGSERCEEYNVC